MKTIKLIITIYTFALMASQSMAEYRTFSGANGKTLEASLISFNPQYGKAKINLKDKGIKTVPISVFSEEDQKYIQEWHKASALLAPSNFKFSIKPESKKTDSISGEADGWKPLKKEGMEYTITKFKIGVQNKSNVPMHNIRIVYYIYHEHTVNEIKYILREIPNWGHQRAADKKQPERVVEEKIKGELLVPTLKPRESVNQFTKDAVIKDGGEIMSNTKTLKGSVMRWSGDLKGILVRVYVPFGDGEFVTRDFSYPSGLLKEIEWPSS